MAYHAEYHDGSLDIANLVTISPARVTHSPKFNTDVHDYIIKFHIDQLPERHDLVDMLSLVYETFVYIFEQLVKDYSAMDYVRIVILAEELKHPIVVPYLPMSKLSVDMVFDAIANVLNSNESLDLTRGLQIHVTRTVLPSGSGPIPRSSEISLMHWLKRKNRSIVMFKNDDNLCLARAIAIAIEEKEHSLVSKKHFRRFVDHTGPQSLQTKFALKLHQDASIPSNRPSYDISDVAKFHQSLLPRFVLHVYDAFLSNLFNGEYDVDSPPNHLYLLHHDGHYSVVKSMMSFTGRRHFCDYCQKGFRTLVHPCPTTKCKICNHLKCENRSNAHFDQDKTTCSHCGKVTYTAHCKEVHDCPKSEKCGKCDQFYPSTKYGRRKHVQGCGKYMCVTCDAYFELPRENHFCFVQQIRDKMLEDYASASDDEIDSDCVDKSSATEPPEKDEDMLFWYDFETMFVDDGHHVPNLLVCVTKRETFIFKGKNLMIEFFQLISSFKRKTNGRLIFMAHNASGFDGMLILRGVYDQGLTPKIFYRGSKILMLELGKRVRFICTYQFLPFSLRELAKNFGLELQKLYFPYLLNREQFLGKEIDFPEEHHFNPDSLRSNEYEEFKVAYDKMRSEYLSAGKKYNVSEELEKYCIADTLVLRDACLAFSTEFEAMTRLKPFSTGITLPSVCLTLYRSQHLPASDMLPVFAPEGIVTKTRYSKICSVWLEWQSKQSDGIYIEGGHNVGEMQIDKYLVDGFHRTPKFECSTIYEFYGCAYHSCPKHYPDTKGVNQLTKLTHGQMRYQYQKKRKALQDTGLRFVKEWECNFQSEVASNAVLRNLARQMGLVRMNRLIPRDALYGGRVEVFNMYAEQSHTQRMDYYDVVSLYPTVMETGQYCIGRPVIIYGFQLPPANEIDFTQYRGLLHVKVLPPSSIAMGVLPLRTKNYGLVFPLCATCAEECRRTRCTHCQSERMMVGVWSHIEMEVALEEGYKIIEVYEIYHFENRSNEVFKSYIRTFMAAKIANSGFPHDISTEADKIAFLQQLYDQTDVEMNVSDITENLVRKQIAKLCLNSLWGKFSQKTKQQTTKIVREPSDFYAMHFNSSIEINDFFHINDDLLHVTYSDLEDTKTRGNICLMVAIETTAMARMMLYKILKSIGGDRLIYCDTDSVIFKSTATDWKPPTKNLFGQLQDEIAGKYGGGYINRFVSLGCKTYGMEIVNENGEFKYEVRCKGISLNMRTAANINFGTMVDLLKNDIGGCLYMEEPYFIQRAKKEAKLLSVYRRKILRYTFRKRLVDFETFKTLPLGYRTDIDS